MRLLILLIALILLFLTSSQACEMTISFHVKEAHLGHYSEPWQTKTIDRRGTILVRAGLDALAEKFFVMPNTNGDTTFTLRDFKFRHGATDTVKPLPQSFPIGSDVKVDLKIDDLLASNADPSLSIEYRNGIVYADMSDGKTYDVVVISDMDGKYIAVQTPQCQTPSNPTGAPYTDLPDGTYTATVMTEDGRRSEVFEVVR